MAPGEDNLMISDQLLNNVKEQEAKSSMDYLYGVVGYTEDQFDAEQRQKLRLLRLSARLYAFDRRLLFYSGFDDICAAEVSERLRRLGR